MLNRVTPFGEIADLPLRGTLMGNRGDLHHPKGVRPIVWRTRRWIACTLNSLSGRKVPLNEAGRYTPLFFTDETVAFAAGHRPCAMCRQQDFERFREALKRGSGISKLDFLPAEAIDRILHSGRLAGTAQRTFLEKVGALPDGSFVKQSGRPDLALLLWRGFLHPWSTSGYGPPTSIASHQLVTVLTPQPIVSALREGYAPMTLLTVRA